MPMPKIRLLPPTIINRIAAGEVIERPASVVKELVENSIDAGARNINIKMCAGGKQEITVSDDGCGMDKPSLQLAIERHATSKLTDDDLTKIKWLGFRGEALPSIGSVSRMRITSKAIEASEAWQIEVDAGKIYEPKPAAHNTGTKIEVKDLFYATPARLKFLKTNRTEIAAASDMIKRLAMTRPDISFCFEHEGRSWHLPATNKLSSRLADILGKEFAQNSQYVEGKRDYVELHGYAAIPTYNRGNSLQQYLFVNGRVVRDKLLLGAIRAAYQDFLARDRYPVLALFITIPPEMVDVNVHPAKAEMRFRDNQLVRSLIIRSLGEMLAKAGHKASSTAATYALEKMMPAKEHSQPLPPSYQNNKYHHSGIYAASGYSNSDNQIASKLLYEASNDAYCEIDNNAAQIAPIATKYATNTDNDICDEMEMPLGMARAQLHLTYIVAQTKDSIIIVDQHAAHERLVYENIKNQMAENGVSTQQLLLPEVVELTDEAIELLLARKEELAELGLIIDSFGQESVIIRAVPAIMGQGDFQGLLQDMADELAEMGEAYKLRDKLEHICATIACHSSVRAGRKLSVAEMNALLRQMEKTPHSGQCNHGRPTYVELKLTDIEKLFGRR